MVMNYGSCLDGFYDLLNLHFQVIRGEELRCLGARDSNQDPLANRIARIESLDLKKPKHLKKKSKGHHSESNGMWGCDSNRAILNHCESCDSIRCELSLCTANRTSKVRRHNLVGERGSRITHTTSSSKQKSVKTSAFFAESGPGIQ